MSELFVPYGQYREIALIAPGPSLIQEDVDKVRASEVFAIVIGDAYKFYPEAQMLYHCDARWWEFYNGAPGYMGPHRVSLEDTGRPNIQHLIRSQMKDGIDLSPSTVVTGSSSGYQALNLACHYKPRRIILLGYDYQRGAGGEYNATGGHPRELPETKNFTEMLRCMGTIYKCLDDLGISVYNCSRSSGTLQFPKGNLDDVL